MDAAISPKFGDYPIADTELCCKIPEARIEFSMRDRHELMKWVNIKTDCGNATKIVSNNKNGNNSNSSEHRQ
jgi:hypothetical protein